ncbi:MAG TPA: hypothetical protein VGL68_10265 [Solirubrobacteraceae bacterium]
MRLFVSASARQVPRLVVALVSVCVVVCGCAVGVAPALSAESQFGQEGEGAGQFQEPTGIAINSETGDVVLADTANNRVDEFTGEGEFVRTWGWGVRDGKPEFEICEAPSRCEGGLPGSGAGQFSKASGVAIDNDVLSAAHGDIYVVDRENDRVERFGPNGEFILSFGEAGAGAGQFDGLGKRGVAVGSTGTVYVGDIGRVQRFSAAGVLEGAPIELAAGGPSVEAINSLAVDASGDLYAQGNEGGVRKFDGAGVELGLPRDSGATAASSIAIGEIAGEEALFVNDPNQGHILGYGPSGAQLLSTVLPDAAGSREGGLVYSNAAPDGALYVAYQVPPAVRVLGLPAPGPAVLEGSEKAGSLLSTSVSLEAVVNPEGAETHYHFEYGETAGVYTNGTAEATLPEGFNDEAVSAPVAGLRPGSVYHFRVVAENGEGRVAGADATFATAPAVSDESEGVSKVSADSALLSTELNAHGLASTYHFEYITQAQFEADGGSFEGPDQPEVLPVPDGEAGESSATATFEITIQHLQAATVYHYRVAARNSLNAPGEYVHGADQTFTTQGAEAVALPDGRAWELVSPPQKHGGLLEPMGKEGETIQAAADGSGIAYVASGPITEEPAGNRSASRSQFLSTRGAPGVWSTKDITTPHQGPTGLALGELSEYKLFSSDLSRAAVEPIGRTPLAPTPSEPSEPDAERTPYVRQPDGTFTPLVYAGNVPAGTKFGGTESKPELFGNGVNFVTATPDLSHVLVSSETSLVEGFDNEGAPAVYEWSEGKLAPVTVLPNETATGGSVGYENFRVPNAISADGSRVVFSAGVGQLYMRDVTLGATGKTLRLDVAQGVKEPASPRAEFQFASTDGSRVFFTDQDRLTSEATAKQGQPDLYECQIEVSGETLSCALTDLSVDPHANEAADVLGAVIGSSEDGTRVYYVANGALGNSGEEARGGVCPRAGEEQCANLYEYDTHSSEPQPRLVAMLSGEDDPDWGTLPAGVENLRKLTARVSPNGRFLAFMSKRSLTGYDNRDAKNAGVRDEEVYEYDAQSGRLACASCDPSGQRPAGQLDEGVFPGLLVDAPLLWGGQTLAGSIPGWTSVDAAHALYQSRYLSDSGRLFFNSPVGLVPGDGNGVQDVYEYEPQTVGSCTLAPACVSLISSGSSSEESAFLDASESGDDVFFLTAAQLSVQDTDTALDIYDAHVCALAPGCASPAAGMPPPCVTADSCRVAPSPQPGIFGEPASQSYSGPGNATPAASLGKSRAKAATRAKLLVKALRRCRAKRNKHKRQACERAARKRYEPAVLKRTTSKRRVK